MGGSLFGGFPHDDHALQRRMLIVGAGLPISLGEYLSATHGWRLFTYTCMHGNLMHIGFNMVALLQIGPLIANTFGFTRTLFIWVASGALAILLPALLVKPSLVVGASGSVFGLIGVAMAYGHRIGTPQGIYIRNKMIEWTVFCTLFGFMMGGIAHSAHFGGLIGGALLSFIIPPARTNAQHSLSPILLVSAILFILWSIWSAWETYQLLF
jgi:rhomboid protease GluP